MDTVYKHLPCSRQLTHFIIHILTLGSSVISPHFRDEETEAQRGYKTEPKSQRQKVAEPAFGAVYFGSQAHWLGVGRGKG